MKKTSKGAFIATMALLSYANYATAQAVSFDSPGKDSGSLAGMVQDAKADRLNIGHIAGEILHNITTPQAQGHHGGPGDHNGPGHHDGPSPQPGPWHPQPPMPPQPFPPQPPMPPQPYPGGDLQGYCQDFDHSQFMAAKNFAYSGSGLNYSDSQATDWALRYDQTHACGTLPEYSARYSALYTYAYSGSYMNMNANDARDYALYYVERMTVPQIQYWQATFQAVYTLFYSGSYMNDNAADAVSGARVWNERGYCGDIRLIENIKAEYARQYGFAYSGSGLNYNSAQAKDYALSAVRNMTSCGDLLR